MELLTVPEAAERLKLARSTVYMLAQRGDLPLIRFGRSIRIPAAALERCIEQRISRPAEPVGVG
ncbi:MAG: helix-turn-helix domain-containing protein [Chloroflexi bacterium]|nr:helix-turn-helix domain-containing protein [Chloroflexota bacterium]